ncbi:ATP-binding cassette domain-containing protein [Vibrio sp. FNV 38]|nr:ATP-binding cassette domain-containing protein [Vibrio sp. FNV 38]
MDIRCDQVTIKTLSSKVSIESWHIEAHHSWAIFCSDHCNLTPLFEIFCGEAHSKTGNINFYGKAALVSLSEQQRLLEIELANDNTDFLDRIDQGRTVNELVVEYATNQTQALALIEQLNLSHLSNTGFRALSTGETRRVMLARAIAANPDRLILNDPFVGLDIEHRHTLQNYLCKLSQSLPILCTISRFEDMPDWVDYVALFGQHTLLDTFAIQDWHHNALVKQLTARGAEQAHSMAEMIAKHRYRKPVSDTIFEIRNGSVEYSDKTIFSGLDWQISAGQHWQIKGPNGCGKSTLLGLIFGDHPQCYSNDIHIFGKQRGTGETIWEIKRQIGTVSSSLHLQYRANCTALEAIISGFYDSIGLYQHPDKTQVESANEWLAILHLSDYRNTPFRQLDYAQQRLILLARALIKQPQLLILDEPYQGLDYLGRLLFKNTVAYLVEQQLCQILFVSHYEEDKISGIDNVLSFIFDDALQCYQVQIFTT